MAVTTITTENFQQEVLAHPGKVIVDFYATWCGPCQAMAPIFAQASEECPAVKFCKVDVDQQTALARQFGVSSIPTLVVFENGKVVNQAVGGRPKEALLALVQ